MWEKKFKPEKSLRLKSYLLHIPKNYDIIDDDLPKNVGPILCGDINELILANWFACIIFPLKTSVVCKQGLSAEIHFLI